MRNSDTRRSVFAFCETHSGLITVLLHEAGMLNLHHKKN